MWVNLSSDTGMGWTFTFTLAARHAWQSLHQAAMPLDMPCQTTFLQSSPLVACGPGGLFAPAWPCLGPLVVVGIAEARLQLPFLGILHCSLERELFPLHSCYSRGPLAGALAATSCRVELTTSARIILVSLRSPCGESILNSLH
jgi:hypothetical protein